jgi:hypothetical protein
MYLGDANYNLDMVFIINGHGVNNHGYGINIIRVWYKTMWLLLP